MPGKFTGLIILDGWGFGEDYEGNAIMKAHTPNFDLLLHKYPNSKLHASGLKVGLPDGQMGNSEVGHLNIGAGRIVYQEFTRISKAIEDGDFFEVEEFIKAIETAKEKGTKLHLMGLFSKGGVHSHSTHLYALVELAKKHGLEEVYVHPFLDGRDVAPQSALEDIKELEAKLSEIGVGKVATVSGRYYAMDRDTRWERTQLAYDALTLGKGVEVNSAVEAVEKSYAGEVFDEFVMPSVVVEAGKPVATIDSDDSIIFFNFRPDRARQITRAIVDADFAGFEREKEVKISSYVCMTQYDASIEGVQVAYKPQKHVNTLGEYLSDKGLKQLRIAETEKYAHVTFFFNGGVELANEGEDRVLINSPKVATYDLQPEMSAEEVKEEAIKRINSNEYDFMVLNFANPDMVGHTGNVDAAVKAVETVDKCLGELIDAIVMNDGKVLITADHGNSEEMKDAKTGSTLTAHTTNFVPCIIVGEEAEVKDGKLADIAPTLLDMMELDKPEEMTGESMLVRK